MVSVSLNNCPREVRKEREGEAEIEQLLDWFGHCKHATTTNMAPANKQINKQTFAMQMNKVGREKEERKQTNRIKSNEQLLLPRLSNSL